MIPGVPHLECLSKIHPAIRAVANWSGVCEIAERTAQVALIENTLQIRLAVSGEAYDLHVRQALHTGLSKVVQGCYLLAEAPCWGDVGTCFEALRDDIGGCSALLEADRNVHPIAAVSVSPPFELDKLLASTALEYAKSKGRVSVVFEAESGRRATAAISIEAHALVCRTVLCRLNEAPSFVRYAESHFLLGLNERLRVARASLLPDRIVLETCIPFRLASPRLLEQAIEALSVGSRVARRECAALTDQNLAHEYLELHWKGD